MAGVKSNNVKEYANFSFQTKRKIPKSWQKRFKINKLNVTKASYSWIFLAKHLYNTCNKGNCKEIKYFQKFIVFKCFICCTHTFD